jgi:hypothetical protein
MAELIKSIVEKGNY